MAKAGFGMLCNRYRSPLSDFSPLFGGCFDGGGHEHGVCYFTQTRMILLHGPKLVARLCLGPEGAGERDWAILAGLMLIGDERVTPITKEVWVQLLPPARIAAVKCELNEVFRAQVLIHLDLLERETDERVYGSLAVALGNCAKQATKFGILDFERALPVWKALNQPILIRRH